MNKTLLIDAHTHIYNNYDIGYLLDCAQANFYQQAQKTGHEDDYMGLLLLSESHGYNYFQEFKMNSTELISSDWKPEPDSESKKGDSLIRFRNLKNQVVYLAAGRQIVTSEGIEVLSLLCAVEVQDGLKLDETLQILFKLNCLIVLPWGVGKWMGKRGRIVRNLLQSIEPGKIAIGDISGRPGVWPLPKHFALAEKRGIKIISGTDPLPIEGEEYRVGKYGCVIDITNLDQTSIDGANIVHNIRDAKLISPYGVQESLFGFLKNQFMIRKLS